MTVDQLDKLLRRIQTRIEYLASPNSLKGWCRIWTGAKSGGRVKYGVVSVHGRNTNVRRLLYSITFPRKKLGNLALHPICGRVDCINPFHMEISSRKKGGRKG